MSALARYFRYRGCRVAGYDRTPTALTGELMREGMDISFTDEVATLPEPFDSAAVREDVLIIYTPAIPGDSVLLNHFKNTGYKPGKRSEVLGVLSRDRFTVAVAGTHGKTSTASMIAHILKASGVDCSAFLGGITVNYNSNVLLGEAGILVVEADEFDRSFLTLHPDVAVVTSMDADHLDVYGDQAHLEESFNLFAEQLRPEGVLIKKAGLPLKKKGLDYALNHRAGLDAGAEDIRIENGNYVFNYVGCHTVIENIIMQFPGLHNVENAVAAATVALKLDVGPEKIRNALGSFRGAKRRFEYIVRQPVIYIDDYAHHPEELRACLSSLRQLYPGKRLTVIFQPHLYTRTRDLADGFAESLGLADELILLDIYPAREQPIKGVSSALIFDKARMADKKMCSKEDLPGAIDKNKTEVLLTAGAGDIDQLVEPIKEYLESRNKNQEPRSGSS